MAKIGVNFRAVCLCLSCHGCRVRNGDHYKLVSLCNRDCGGRPDCMPLIGCPGYAKEDTAIELRITVDDGLPF